MHRSNLFGALLIILLFLSIDSAAAQAPGYAEIISPAPGEAVMGLVTIEGSASHPLFIAYDLAFTYQDSSVETWFDIVESRAVEVVDERLGLWDTNGISDGVYKLRLRIFLDNGTKLEDIIEGIRVRNASPIETPTPAAVSAFEPTGTPIPITPTARPTPSSLPASADRTTVQQAFRFGLALGTGLFIALVSYLYIRRKIRIRWGMLRMRRMLWQEERKKRRGK